MFLNFKIYLFLLKLIKKSLSFEVVRNIVIKSGNDFVDLFLPTWIQIFAKLNRLEKFAESLFHHPSKSAGYLLKTWRKSSRKWGLFQSYISFNQKVPICSNIFPKITVQETVLQTFVVNGIIAANFSPILRCHQTWTPKSAIMQTMSETI